VLNQSLVAGAILAVVLTGLGFAYGRYVVELMQVQPPADELARRYLKFLIPLIPAMMFEQVGIACLRGAGDTVTGLVTMTVVNVTNIAVAWSLLMGVGSWPSAGWDSVGIGTACGHFIGGLIPLVLLLRGRAGLKIEAALLKPDRALMRRILRIGIPGGFDINTIVICQLVFLSIVTRLGVLATAAHGVAIRIESLAYLPGTAFQVAAATLSGQYLGAGNYKQAARSVMVACLLGLALMTTAGLVMLFGADQLVSWFIGADQPEVRAMAAPLLRIISFAMPPLALLNILNGALRGAGDTRWTLVISLFGFLGVRMPLAWYLCHVAGWGVRGAWYSMAIDLTLRCVLVTTRFFHGGWKRVRV
jgi:putative MATE family efflux protein